MAYDEGLAQRIRELMAPRDGVAERKMFGGIGWMVGGNMACGVIGDDLLVRLGTEAEEAWNEPHAGPFLTPKGTPMGGFVRVAAEGVAEDRELADWVDAGAGFAASLPPK
jgi:TfoX/Sxy family transcriptional regulator of competence genes